MTAPWNPGRGKIDEMLRARDLEQLTGEAADGEFHLDRADTAVASAEALTGTDPSSSLTLAYDAYRTGLGALLAHQGLRVTTAGGHVAYGAAARAQFPGHFDEFDHLRRMRHVTEYPRSPTDTDVTVSEAREACAMAREACEAARKLLPHLGLWR
jgi:hypothetical protein